MYDLFNKLSVISYFGNYLDFSPENSISDSYSFVGLILRAHLGIRWDISQGNLSWQLKELSKRQDVDRILLDLLMKIDNQKTLSIDILSHPYFLFGSGNVPGISRNISSELKIDLKKETTRNKLEPNIEGKLSTKKQKKE